MPRTSSFSVRDILDLPQMKTSSEGSVTTGGVETDAISHATDLYAAASAQRLQGNVRNTWYFGLSKRIWNDTQAKLP